MDVESHEIIMRLYDFDFGVEDLHFFQLCHLTVLTNVVEDFNMQMDLEIN